MSSKKKEVYPDGFVPVEYLQSSGSQRINTGVAPDVNAKYTVDFIQYDNAVSIFGTGWGFYCQITNNHVRCLPYYNGNEHTYWLTNRYRIEMDRNSVSVTNHGYTYTSASISDTQFDSSGTIGLFSRYGNLQDIAGNVRIYSFKIEKNGETTMDLVPGRIGQVGYMYDKVSGQLFGNVGSGNFTLGNDV